MAEVSMALLLFVMLTLRWLATVAAVVVGVWIAQRMAAPHSSLDCREGRCRPDSLTAGCAYDALRSWKSDRKQNGVYGDLYAQTSKRCD